MTRRALSGGYELDDDPARIDVDAVHAFLTAESYWAAGRSRSLTELLVRDAARVVGLYAPDGALVGFARAVSDRHTVAWLADVFVAADHRGQGLGSELVHETIEASGFPHVRWLLATRDAHELYGRHGFILPCDRLMERPRR